jgi:hypothetical protein
MCPAVQGGLVFTTAHAAPTFGLLPGPATFIIPAATTSGMPKSGVEYQKGTILGKESPAPG